jgi:hypothetical protein
MKTHIINLFRISGYYNREPIYIQNKLIITFKVMFPNVNQNQNQNYIQQINTNTNDLRTLKNQLDQANQTIANLQNQLNLLNNQRNQSLENQIANGLERISKKDIKENDNANDIKDKQRDFINFRNVQRKIMGLNTLSYVTCRICKMVNAHYTNNCPKQICSYCLRQGHNWRSCVKRFRCQICGKTDHSSRTCMAEGAEDMRADSNRICMLCGTKGHIAKNCDKTNGGYRPRTAFKRRRFSVKRGFSGRGRFRVRGGRKDVVWGKSVSGVKVSVVRGVISNKKKKKRKRFVNYCL